MQTKVDSESGCGESVRSESGRATCAETGRRGFGGWGRRAVRSAWEVVTVPERQGLETVDILRLRGGCGAVLLEAVLPEAVLLEGGGSTLSFLVPSGTSAQWQLPGSSCRAVSAPGTEMRWLLPPTVGGPGPVLTDPAELRAALGEAARTLAASDKL